MANKKIKKVPLNKTCLLESLQLNNSNIRKLGSDYTFGWSSKSIERGIKDGEVSPELLDALGQYLNVEPDYLSGKYHRLCEKISNDEICFNLKKDLCAKKFPYIKKQQKTMYEGKFLYDKYLEFMLIIHDISMQQFNNMLFEQQKSLQLDIEDAIVPILIKYFPKNAMGQNTYPEIYRLRENIDNFNLNEPEPSTNFFLDNN